MASTTNHYDLIVLGSDVAGLVAAALVARRGKRVLVIPHGAADGTYRLGGQPLPLTSAPVVHMGTPPVKRVFQELGLLQQVRRQHASVDGLIHVALASQRLDLEPGEANGSAELSREWPDDQVDDANAHRLSWREAVSDVLDQLLASENGLVAEGFWGRRFLARVASQLPGPETDEFSPLPAEHPWRDAARAYEPWLLHLNPQQLGKAASLRLSGLWSLGPEDLPRGHIRVRELLLQRIGLHSGEVKPELRVGEVILKRGRVVGITLLGKRDRYGCDHMILATDPRRLLDGVLPPEHVPKSLLGNLQAIEAVAHRYLLHLEVHEEGLSPALAGMVQCLPRDIEPERGRRALGLGRTFVRLDSGTGDGMRRITIERIIPAGASLHRMRERILDELDERGILPFCRPHVRWMHSPHDGREAMDGSGSPRHELRSSSSIAQTMSAIYHYHGTPTLGVGILPYESGIKALHLASRLTLPGLGLEGEFAAGTAAAGLVAPPARSPFARSPLLSRA